MLGLKGSPLGGLAQLRNVRSKRYSSWDRTGGNDDRLHLQPGETATLASIPGAGTVVHIWITIASEHAEPEPISCASSFCEHSGMAKKTPSIEVPVGDFFGVGHAQSTNFVSLPLQMSPQDGKGFNCWFPDALLERRSVRGPE
jgi:hypothetical protein